MDLYSDGRGGSGLQVGIRVLFLAEVQAEAALFHGSHWFRAFFSHMYQCASLAVQDGIRMTEPLRNIFPFLLERKQTNKKHYKKNLKTHIVSKKMERSPLTAGQSGDMNASDNLRGGQSECTLNKLLQIFHQVQAMKLPQMSNHLFCFDSVNLFDVQKTFFSL